MIGWILLVLFLFVLIWLMWAPLRLEVDSEAGRVQLEWGSIGRVLWDADVGLDVLQMRILFFNWNIRMGASLPKPARQKEKKQESSQPRPEPKRDKAKRNFWSPKTIWRLVRRVLHTFKVRYWRIVWDSDDFVLNAYLYPIAYILNTKTKGTLEINFLGKREMAFVVENRLSRLAWVVLKTLVFKR